MYSMYFTLTSICNQNCTCCPYTENDEIFPEMRREDVENAVRKASEDLRKKGKESAIAVVLSGGEPALYTELPMLIGNLQEMGAQAHLLSNGECFADAGFLGRMDESVDWSRLRVTTTLHSHEKEKHEAANRKKGSFDRTLSGLHNMDLRGAQIIVKHCITGTNYRDLCEFYRFVDLEFGKHVPLYLCGIDYIGIPEERVKREKIGLPEIRPALERMFDTVEENENHRPVYASHIPLCWADPYYWKYLTLNHPEQTYNASGKYGDVHWNAASDTGTADDICPGCIVRHLCMGTYFSAFKVLEKTAFRPYSS